MFGDIIERFLADAVEGYLYCGGRLNSAAASTATGILVRPEKALPNRPQQVGQA